MPRAPFAPLLLALTLTVNASAQSFTVLHTFQGNADGSVPHGRLFFDPQGNLYGTTMHGGVDQWGTLFRIASNGKKTVVHFFSPNDGTYPTGGLIADAQPNAYGVTFTGSTTFGVVYKIDRFGNETILHVFSNPQGANPYGELVRDGGGNFYGTTSMGGAHQFGTLYKLAANGDYTVLHDFEGPGDGSNPFTGLILDSAGVLYGTTVNSVFEYDTTSDTYTVLHVMDQATGTYSLGSLVQDSQGFLYGTNSLGGAGECGNVFKVDVFGNYAVLHDFTCGADGSSPSAGLTFGPDGNLYGTTALGGAYFYGTVFRMDTSGNEKVLHNFNRRDGQEPYEPLIFDPSGNLYGTTLFGGHYSGVGQGDGVVFKLSP